MGLGAALALAGLIAQSPARAIEAPASQPASKKDAYLAEKAARSEKKLRPLRVHQRAEAPIWAFNLYTHEITTLTGPGRLPDTGLDAFFQCWFTLEHTDIPEALIERVIATARRFGRREVRIISSYRHPKYNLSLVKKGREVARNSQHTRGNAIDFYLPGVDVTELYRYLLEIHEGGVGYYPVSAFVHVDLGRKRTWNGT